MIHNTDKSFNARPAKTMPENQTALINACDKFGGAAQIGDSVYWVIDTKRYDITENAQQMQRKTK